MLIAVGTEYSIKGIKSEYVLAQSSEGRSQ